jgi:hypothetical protein
MQLFFAGAESPSHLRVLRDEGVTQVAVNVTALSRRAKDLTGWASQERLEGLEWILYADTPSTPWEAALSLLEGAEVPPEAIIGPLAWATETRLGSGDIFFLPTWDGQDRGALRAFIDDYGGVALPDTVVASATSVRSAIAATTGPSAVLAAITGRSKGIEQFDIVLSSAWWAVQKHGETQVWDQGKLHRYNSEDKLAKRQQHGAAITALGVDLADVLADDPKATVQLAIRSWQQLEARQSVKGSLTVLNAPTEGDLVANSRMAHPSQGGSEERRVASPPPTGRHETFTLPVMGMEKITTTTTDAQGVETSTDTNTLSVSTQSLRKCDTCSLSMHCEAYNAGSRCAYNIPVVIRSKDDLTGVMRAGVEIQTQRIMMMRFAEEITGAPDPEVGREMDRLFNMVGKWKEIEDNRDTLEMTVRAKGNANTGMLSRLFGAKVGSNAMQLDTPIPSEVVDSVLRS